APTTPATRRLGPATGPCQSLFLLGLGVFATNSGRRSAPSWQLETCGPQPLRERPVLCRDQNRQLIGNTRYSAPDGGALRIVEPGCWLIERHEAGGGDEGGQGDENPFLSARERPRPARDGLFGETHLAQ